MKKTKLYILIISAFSMFSSCIERGQFQNELKKIMSTPMILPLDSFECINTNNSNTKTSPLKLVIYADSIECTSCRIRQMALWYPQLLKVKAKHRNVLDVLFIFSVNSYQKELIITELEKIQWDFTTYFDNLKLFERSNMHLTKNEKLHTFLVDSSGNVLMVGNPFENKEVNKIFNNILDNCNHSPNNYIQSHF